MPQISASLTVNEVLRRWPATASVLNRHAVDMCCGGGLRLDLAAASAGVDLAVFLRELEAAAAGETATH